MTMVGSSSALCEGNIDVFNLPSFTTAMILGLPAFWILYAVVFLVISRNYKSADADE